MQDDLTSIIYVTVYTSVIMISANIQQMVFYQLPKKNGLFDEIKVEMKDIK